MDLAGRGDLKLSVIDPKFWKATVWPGASLVDFRLRANQAYRQYMT